MNQATFTKGPVTYDGMGCLMGGKPKQLLAQEISNPADADLIAAAFNAATACQDMGYDGIKAVEALPKLLKSMEWIIGRLQRGGAGAVSDAMMQAIDATLLADSAGQKPRGKDYDTPEGA